MNNFLSKEKAREEFLKTHLNHNWSKTVPQSLARRESYLKKQLEIWTLYKEGEKASEIAKSFGISRERIYQYLRPITDFQFKKEETRKLRLSNCLYCGKSFERQSKGSKTKFCSHDCARHSRFAAFYALTPEEKLARKRKQWRERMRIYYHTVLKLKPEWKEITAERNKKSQEKLRLKKHDPTI